MMTRTAIDRLFETDQLQKALFLKKGQQLQPITAEQASQLMDVIRNATFSGGGGGRDVQDIKLYDGSGIQIGYVSMNGRVWIGKWPNATEIKIGNRKTAKEQDKDGWVSNLPATDV